MRASVVVVIIAGFIALFTCGVACDEPCSSTEQAMATDEQTPLGFSAEDLRGRVAGPHEATFTYTFGGNTMGMTTELLRLVGDVRYVHREPKPWADESMCGEYLIVDAEASFATDDGAFEELLEAHVCTYPEDTGDRLHLYMGNVFG